MISRSQPSPLAGPLDASDATPSRTLGRVLYRPIAFMQPDRTVAPASWLEHVPFAFWLTDVLRPAVFVELGTHSGNSYSAFAQAVRHLGLATACYAVDTWKGDTQAGLYGEEVFAEWEAYHDARFSAFSRLVRSTFDEALSHFTDGTIDLLHIDGYHTYESVMHDLEAWRPKLSRRGVVLLHDINVREGEFGAWRAWQEATRETPSFEFLHGHGLGVLAVGPEVPPELVWLCTLGDEARGDAAAVRQFFARLGSIVLADYRAARARASLEAGVQDEMDSRGVYAAMSEALEVGRSERAKLLEQVRQEREAHARVGAELEQARTAVARETQQLRAEAARAVDALNASRAALAAIDTEAAMLWRRVAGAERERAEVERALRRSERRLAVSGRPQAHATGRITSGGSRFAAVRQTLHALGLAPRQIATRPRRAGIAARLLFRPSLLRAAHITAQSGDFDPAYYEEPNDQKGPRSLTPLAHYILAGGREGRAPHPLFDGRWYLERNPDVAANGVNPLVHYVRQGSREGRDPHPLFASAYYLERYPELRSHTHNLLRHYVEYGWLEGRTPHPLFDPDYYLTTYEDVAAAGTDPLAHFVQYGWREGRDPHPLFDTRGYLARYADVRTAGSNPLVHYVLAGGKEGRQPHPLFDSRFYLSRYPDVAASGVDPLSHYLLAGAPEGRDPGPFFSTTYYASTYPDVPESGLNPLLHFAVHGWREGRNPSPSFDTRAYLARYRDVARSGVNPLVHYISFGRSEGRDPGPHDDPAEQLSAVPLFQQRVRLRAAAATPAASDARVVLCLTHVMPVEPRAGNEYRIHRMLKWLRESGYSVVPIIAPLDDFRPSAEQLAHVVEEFSNVVYCPRDGRIQYVLRDLPDVLGSLDGEYTLNVAALLGEAAGTIRERELLQVDRTFCSDALVTTFLRLQHVLGRYILLAEYIWMSRLLPLASPRALKVIDTIDVFSTRREKVDQFGIDDWVLDADAERERLRRADVIVAIQENERSALQALVPHARILTAGVDFDVSDVPGAPGGQTILLVASGNPMNRRGLADFLRFAWPKIAAAVPAAELRIAGAVADAIGFPPERVQVLGRVSDLGPLYRGCRLVINPAVAGTGVKVKTLEALSYLRPIVTWPNGVDGLSTDLAGMCIVAEDWYEYAQRVVEVLQSDRQPWFSPDDRAVIAGEGAAARVYAELGRTFGAFFDHQAPEADKNTRTAQP